MKIGFVLDDTLDSTDGIQQYILTLGTWLKAHGHEVHYLVGETKRDDITVVHSLSRNMRVRFNGNRMSMPLPAGRTRIAELLKREKYDVLHVQIPYSPWMAHRVIMAAPARTAIVGTFHIAPHSKLVHYAAASLALWTRRSLKRFDRIVSVSSAAADFARRSYHIDTAILPNVVVEKRFAVAKPFPRYANKPTIVFLGRLVPRKGCMTLLQALSHLKTQEPQLDFQVVVCGPGPLRAELEAFVEHGNLATLVEFTGFVSEEDKPRYLKSADLAIFPSSGGESFGIVLIEAMSADHPVVLAADNPGYAAVMSPYPDTLIPVGDVPTLANKIRLFLRDKQAGKAARDWQSKYVKQFDVEVVGPRLLELYGESLHDPNTI